MDTQFGDDHGWQIAKDFPNKGSRSVWSAQFSAKHNVRRRRWTRTLAVKIEELILPLAK